MQAAIIPNTIPVKAGVSGKFVCKAGLFGSLLF